MPDPIINLSPLNSIEYVNHRLPGEIKSEFDIKANIRKSLSVLSQHYNNIQEYCTLFMEKFKKSQRELYLKKVQELSELKKQVKNLIVFANGGEGVTQEGLYKFNAKVNDIIAEYQNIVLKKKTNRINID